MMFTRSPVHGHEKKKRGYKAPRYTLIIKITPRRGSFSLSKRARSSANFEFLRRSTGFSSPRKSFDRPPPAGTNSPLSFRVYDLRASIDVHASVEKYQRPELSGRATPSFHACLLHLRSRQASPSLRIASSSIRDHFVSCHRADGYADILHTYLCSYHAAVTREPRHSRCRSATTSPRGTRDSLQFYESYVHDLVAVNCKSRWIRFSPRTLCIRMNRIIFGKKRKKNPRS